MSFLQTSDLSGYLEFWEHLDQRFYSRLDASFTSSARKLDLLLKRYYLVVCVQNGKTDKIADFYRRLSSEIQSSSEWRDWLSECRLMCVLCASCMLRKCCKAITWALVIICYKHHLTSF